MNSFILALAASILVSTTAFAQQPIKQRTGVDVPGCTFYKLVDNKVVCSPVWKEGYKATLSNAASE